MIDIKMHAIEYDVFIKKYQNEMLKKQEVLTYLNSKEIIKHLNKSKRKVISTDINDLDELKFKRKEMLISALTIKSCDDKRFKIIPIVENHDKYNEYLSDSSQQYMHCLTINNILEIFAEVDFKAILSNVVIIINTTASFLTVYKFAKDLFEKIIKKMNIEKNKDKNFKSKYSDFTLKIWENGMVYEIKCKNSTADEIKKLLETMKKMR